MPKVLTGRLKGTNAPLGSVFVRHNKVFRVVQESNAVTCKGCYWRNRNCTAVDLPGCLRQTFEETTDEEIVSYAVALSALKGDTHHL